MCLPAQVDANSSSRKHHDICVCEQAMRADTYERLGSELDGMEGRVGTGILHEHLATLRSGWFSGVRALRHVTLVTTLQAPRMRRAANSSRQGAGGKQRVSFCKTLDKIHAG